MKRFPAYPKRPHKSGQARIWLGKHVYLGIFGSAQSHAEYERLYSEWRRGRAEPLPLPSTCRTVEELVDAWECWAEDSQRDAAGRVRGEVRNKQYAYEPLLRVYGDLPPADFGTRELLRLQEVVAAPPWSWSRSYLNRGTSRVKALFAWGEQRGLVPKGKSAELFIVRGIGVGDHGARETEEVAPVEESVVLATLAELRPVVRAAVQVLRWTGARPSEVLGLRPADLRRDGRVTLARGFTVELPPGVWYAQPARHKTAHRGNRRVILFGPQAQAVLAPFLDRPPTAYLFSPAEEVAGWREEQRAARQTPVQPSQVDRGKPRPRRRPSDRYDHRALAHAIRRACERAGVEPWSAYQLRHAFATELSARFGVEVARTVLGHGLEKMTDRYALPAIRRAAEAVLEIG